MMKAKKHQESLTTQHFNISVHEHIYNNAYLCASLFLQNAFNILHARRIQTDFSNKV